jgi:hypothetical protein
MPATQSTADRFYAIFRPLLFYVNARLQIVPHLHDAAEIARWPVAEVNQIRKAVWANDPLRGDFIEQNPANLSGEDLMIVASWNYRCAGKFFAFRHLKPHSSELQESREKLAKFSNPGARVKPPP